MAVTRAHAQKKNGTIATDWLCLQEDTCWEMLTQPAEMNDTQVLTCVNLLGMGTIKKANFTSQFLTEPSSFPDLKSKI